jgi:hypothetical protein
VGGVGGIAIPAGMKRIQKQIADSPVPNGSMPAICEKVGVPRQRAHG